MTLSTSPATLSLKKDQQFASLQQQLRMAHVDGVPVALCGCTASATPATPAKRRLRSATDVSSWSLDRDNLLLDVDGSMRLSVVARLCREQGVHFAFPRPVSALRVREACAAIPIFVEAFVASIDGVTLEGERIQTPRAPRSAQGPDWMGALLSRPPLLVADRVRLRVFRSEHMRSSVHHGTSEEHAAALVGLLAQGRAFVAWAQGGTRTVLHGMGSPLGKEGDLLTTLIPEDDVAPKRNPLAFHRKRSGMVLGPADQSAMVDALSRGAQLVAAPFMGRVGTIEEQAVSVVLHASQAADDFAAALVVAAEVSASQQGFVGDANG